MRLLLAAAALLACALPALAERPVVRVSVDTEGSTTRVLLTHTRYVTRVLMVNNRKLELLYAEPVTLEPASGRVDSDLLAGWSQLDERRILFEPGPGYQRHETFELSNPDRLVIDIQGETDRGPGGIVTTTPAERKSRKRNRTVVVIDPGHGGSEFGASGPSGLLEKEVTLDLAQRLKQQLQQNRGVSVVLTRDEDRQLDLDERTAIANHNRADLFLSVHVNSSPRRSAVGAETYYLSTEATDDEARTLAALENRSFTGDGTSAAGDGRSGDDPLDLILWDLAQNRFQSQSSALAQSIQDHLNRLTGTRDRGVRQAPFRVLMGATMPAVLVEVGFISNPSEESQLRGLSYRNRIVEAIAAAVEEFLLENRRLAAPAGGAGPDAEGH